MKQMFTTNEVKLAVKSLKNDKSTGTDDFHAELMKYGPDEICENT